MRTPTELTEAFRARGLKVTPQRQLLFRLLHGNTQHPTAEALFATASAEMPGISLRTVYQTLADLASMGELQQVAFGSGPTRFDPNVDEHHHVVCDRCGAVRDVWVDGIADLRMAPLDGFEPSVTEIVLHGRCAACAATEPTASTVPPINQPTS
ncbi:MAG: transcriptional repressor [Ilumatobacteraceae bacterium]|nr:transcriptional repressor [Ilumatobacteraceae bacterium]